MISDVYVSQILYAAIDFRLGELPGFVLEAVLILNTLLIRIFCIYNKQLTRFEGAFADDAAKIRNLLMNLLNLSI